MLSSRRSFLTSILKYFPTVSRQRNREALRIGTEVIEILSGEFDVTRITDYQFRIDGRIDLFPVNGKWHDILRNVRGHYAAADVVATVNFLNKQMNTDVKLLFTP